MKVFISWSGERSKALAEELRQWLKLVIQTLEPWISTHDIDAGVRWLDALNKELSENSFGIICLTPYNQSEPWILFEAGALANKIEKSHVVPYLIDLEPSGIHFGPLSQFQAKRANRKETRELIDTINKNLKNPLPDNQLEETFGVWWPRLDNKLRNLPELESIQKPKRSLEDMVKETLELVRQISRSTTADEIPDRLGNLSHFADPIVWSRLGISDPYHNKPPSNFLP
jgi:hypothetical protein